MGLGGSEEFSVISYQKAGGGCGGRLDAGDEWERRIERRNTESPERQKKVERKRLA